VIEGEAKKTSSPRIDHIRAFHHYSGTEEHTMLNLTQAQLEGLRTFDTPTISNAIERFGIRSKSEGVMTPEIKCILPYGKTMIGYACTGKISAVKPPTPAQADMMMAYYEKLQKTARPSIAVLQDMDPAPTGSFWGEVNATVHKALGCVGTVTDGGVRDLNEVGPLGFGFFAKCLLVTHAYIHLEAYDCPVTVGGLTVNPGDLLAADRHGVILIPGAVAKDLAEACKKAADAELPVLEGCRKAMAAGAEVDLEDLKKWRAEMARLRTAK
jgi:regulator of RNase E activity RraA